MSSPTRRTMTSYTRRAASGGLLSRDDPEEILSFREHFERLRDASLGIDGTIDFLRELISGLS